MTDLPPRTTPRSDDRRVTPTRYSQASMWLVMLVLAAVILAAVAFSMNRSTTVAPATIEQAETTTPAQTETAPAGTGTTTDTDTGTGTSPTPAPGTGGTTQPAP